MNMTHYMSLLAANQPWNLIIFMAIPVICAETLTITEFFSNFSPSDFRSTPGGNRIFHIQALKQVTLKLPITTSEAQYFLGKSMRINALQVQMAGQS